MRRSAAIFKVFSAGGTVFFVHGTPAWFRLARKHPSERRYDTSEATLPTIVARRGFARPELSSQLSTHVCDSPGKHVGVAGLRPHSLAALSDRESTYNEAPELALREHLSERCRDTIVFNFLR